MPRIIETLVYTIDELPDSAKKCAIDKYRDIATDHDWYDVVFEDFTSICDLLGITIRNSARSGSRGRTCNENHIYFSGFSSQGDGASFEGSYSHARGATDAIRSYAPLDKELHAIADDLARVQRRNFYQLHARIRQSGYYTHEYTMNVETERDSPTLQAPSADAEKTVAEAMRRLARWLYRQLQASYEYLSSDACVGETLAFWTFTTDGIHFGYTSDPSRPCATN